MYIYKTLDTTYVTFVCFFIYEQTKVSDMCSQKSNSTKEKNQQHQTNKPKNPKPEPYTTDET